MRTSLWVSVLLLSLAGGAVAVAGPPLSAFAGEWGGSCVIVVDWTRQRELPVALTIAPDGTVSGTVGDARLVRGRVAINRGWLGRKLNVKTDYIVVGRLEGCVLASEGVCRDGVKIPLWFRDGRLEGGLHTSGWFAGGKERMVLSARGLSLTRRK
jgi:hypothetical protein